MGNLLRRQANAAEELEQIVSKLQMWEGRSTTLRRQRYAFMRWAAIVVLLVASVSSAVACVDAESHQLYQRVAFVWTVGTLVFFLCKLAAGASFDFLLRRTERNIDFLNERRAKIIESVKENEKFKVAKGIIEKYGSAEDLADLGGDSTGSPKAKVAARRAPERRPAALEPISEAAERAAMPPPASKAPAPQELVPHTPVPLLNVALRTPIQRQPARPFVQVSRTPIDKIIDYIIGDGPSNRFALICKQCHAHNGMALKEEFGGISFVCYNCGFYNPARNEKPLRTPRRALAGPAELPPPSRPYIRTATNTDSSDNDEAEPVDTVGEGATTASAGLASRSG